MRRATSLIIISVLLCSVFSVLAPPAIRSDGTNDPVYFNQNTESETDSSFYTISSTVNSFTRGWAANQTDGQGVTKYGLTLFSNTEPSEYQNASFFIEGQDSSEMTEWIPSSSGPMTVAFYITYMVSGWDNIDPLNLPEFEIFDPQNLQMLTSGNVTTQANQWSTTMIYTTIDAGRSFRALWSFNWTNMPPLTPNIYIDSWRVVTFDSEETLSQAPTDQYRMAGFGPNTAGFYGGTSGTLSGQTVSVQICDIMGTGVPGLSLWYDGTKTLVTRIPMNTSNVQNGYQSTYQPGLGESVWGTYSFGVPDGTYCSGYRLVLASKDIIYTAGYMLQIGPFIWGRDPWHEAWTYGFIEYVDTSRVVASWISKFSSSNWGLNPDCGALPFESGGVPMSEITTPSMGVYRKNIPISSFGVSGSRFFLSGWGPAWGYSGWIPTSWASLCSVSFDESGLPPGDTWNATLNGVTSDSTSDTTITFSVPIGSYPFEIKSTVDLASTGLLLSPIYQDTIEIINVEADTSVSIAWLERSLPVIIKEVGLPPSTGWSVTYGCITQTSYADEIEYNFPMSGGAYSFRASSPGYLAEPASFIANVSGIATNVAFIPSSNIAHFTSWSPFEDSYSAMNPNTIWSYSGSCYGLSSTALLYFMHYTLDNTAYPLFPSQYPYATASTSGLDLDGSSALNNASLAVMFHQVYDPHRRGIGIPSVSDVNKADEYGNLLENLTQGHPVVMVLGNATNWYHAAVAWGTGMLANGSYAIVVYDPNYPQLTEVAIYDPTIVGFSYGVTPDHFDRFAIVNPDMISTSWAPLDQVPWWQNFLGTYWWWNDWLSFSVPNYNVVISDKNVTIDSGGLEDTFTEMGNSQTFIKGIPGSSGIEEGNVQIYGILGYMDFTISDPASNQSTIFISRVSNESGQVIGCAYLLNATTTEGYLNFTVTPKNSGLSIITGDNALNASVTCFSATQQGYSVSQVSNITVDAMEMVNFTAFYTMTVVPSQSVVDQGCNLPINVTMINGGVLAETFNVTVYANDTATGISTVIATFTNVTIGAGNSTTLTLTMDTTGFPAGDYIINAHATLVPSETGAIYNTFAGSTVRIVQATNGGGGGRMPYID